MFALGRMHRKTAGRGFRSGVLPKHAEPKPFVRYHHLTNKTWMEPVSLEQ